MMLRALCSTKLVLAPDSNTASASSGYRRHRPREAPPPPPSRTTAPPSMEIPASAAPWIHPRHRSAIISRVRTLLPGWRLGVALLSLSSRPRSTALPSIPRAAWPLRSHQPVDSPRLLCGLRNKHQFTSFPMLSASPALL